MCTQKKSSSVKITLLLKVDLEGREPNALPAISLLCTPYALREKKNQRIFVYIKCSASPMDFRDCKYDHQAADFQDEAIWDVIWLADK